MRINIENFCTREKNIGIIRKSRQDTDLHE